MYQTCNTGGICNEEGDNSSGLLISNESSALPCEYSGFDIVKATQYGALQRVKELVDGGFDVSNYYIKQQRKKIIKNLSSYILKGESTRQ
jgi:hypothetical protein